MVFSPAMILKEFKVKYCKINENTVLLHTTRRPNMFISVDRFYKLKSLPQYKNRTARALFNSLILVPDGMIKVVYTSNFKIIFEPDSYEIRRNDGIDLTLEQIFMLIPDASEVIFKDID